MSKIRRRIAGPLAAWAALLAVPTAAGASLGLSTVGTFSAPTYVAGTPGDTHRLYVVERGGTIRVVRDGTVLPTPFVDLTSDPGTNVSTGGERGLLSMAFPSDFRASRLFYVYFTDAAGNVRVDQLRAPTDDQADPPASYDHTVISITHPASNHNGGTVQFGPDGYLYMAPGDGASSANAQDLGSVLGKVLRIRPRPGADGFDVPPDNPFGSAVWAYGLRNPFRFSFDRATGDLAIGDVGESTTEEVDFAPGSSGGGRGANFGWPTCEGSFLTGSPGDACTASGSVLPAIDQFHANGWIALIGGYVSRDPTMPSLCGRYVYTDNGLGDIRSAVLRTPRGLDDRPTGLHVSHPAGFGEDAAGHLYVASLDGPVYRLTDDAAPSPCPPPSAGTAGPAGPTVASSPPEDTPPRLVVRVPPRERVLRRRAVIAYARCSEHCTVSMSATLRIGRRSYRLLHASRTIPADVRGTLRGGLTRRARRALRSARAHHRRAYVRVALRAGDGAGNRSPLIRRTVRVRL